MICIIDYGVGNLASIQNMFKKAGVQASIGTSAEQISQASKLLLPGMGHFDNCMVRINNSGLLAEIERKVFEEKTPLLGICVGLQMFMASSEEGVEKGLGWIKGRTVKFDSAKMSTSQKIPNMGWLEVTAVKSSPIWEGLEGSRFYFAHSYHVQLENREDELVMAEYGYNFTVGVEHANIIGVQFHPEKSHRFGMQLLKNFATNY
jgi:glutamine amidotransferase